MAQPKTIPFDDAMLAVDAYKIWPRGVVFDWKSSSTKRFPAPYSFRTSLALNDAQTKFAEDWFVELYYKKSSVPAVRDTISITLIVNKSRVIAIDDNGSGSHLNKVGVGLPHYQTAIDFPHLHIPVPESSYGYAEPLNSTTVQERWSLFLAKAIISGAPRIELPEAGQLDLNV